MTDLHHLGKQTNTPTDTLDCVAWTHGPITITLEVTEFTSLCPVTAQPDFGTLTIAYVPDAQIVETKSLKLWLWRWRDKGAFNEAIVASLAADFFAQVAPLRVTVTGHFHCATRFTRRTVRPGKLSTCMAGSFTARPHYSTRRINIRFPTRHRPCASGIAHIIFGATWSYRRCSNGAGVTN